MGYIRPAIVFLIAPVFAAAAQVAILQIRVVEGEASVHIPGSRARPIVVEVTDETGGPVAGAAVSFHLPEDGPGGVFANGLRTAIATTDARGRAAVQSLQINRYAGRFQIRIVASKEHARAGAVSLQYIAEEGAIAATRPQPSRLAPAAPRTAAPAAAAGRNRSRWYIVAALAGGGIAAGVLAARRSGPAAPATAPAPPQQPPVLTIGVPSIGVGKP